MRVRSQCFESKDAANFTKEILPMNRKMLRGATLPGCVVLAFVWAMLALPGNSLANPPDGDGNHNHGGGDGGGGGGEEAILFDVTTPAESDMAIIGVFGDFDPEADGIITTPTGCSAQEGPAEGRADKRQVIVNRPSPAIQMDFLAALPECFTVGDIYALGCGGDLVIRQAQNGSASIAYFFGARGRNGDVQSYVVSGDAIIVADNGGSFPKGDTGYTVFVGNISVSQDTGPRSNACEGSFPDALAEIRLDRIP